VPLKFAARLPQATFHDAPRESPRLRARVSAAEEVHQNPRLVLVNRKVDRTRRHSWSTGHGSPGAAAGQPEMRHRPRSGAVSLIVRRIVFCLSESNGAFVFPMKGPCNRDPNRTSRSVGVSILTAWWAAVDGLFFSSIVRPLNARNRPASPCWNKQVVTILWKIYFLPDESPPASCVAVKNPRPRRVTRIKTPHVTMIYINRQATTRPRSVRSKYPIFNLPQRTSGTTMRTGQPRPPGG
jgi:hypothetical protein